MPERPLPVDRSPSGLQLVLQLPEDPQLVADVRDLVQLLGGELMPSFPLKPEIVEDLQRRAQAGLGEEVAVPSLGRFWRVYLPTQLDLTEAANCCAKLGTEFGLGSKVVVAGRAIPDVLSDGEAGVNYPPGPLQDPPRYPQGHLRDDGGINARWAWGQPGGDGCGIWVCDCEFGFDPEHLDLPPVAVVSARGNDLRTNRDHGTSSLGVLGARANRWGITGIAHRSLLLFASESGGYRPQCVGDALARLRPGDVLLLEMQAWVVDQSIGRFRPYPAEYDPDIHAAVLTAAGLGVTVVAAAGSCPPGIDALDLAQARDAQDRAIWDPRGEEWHDSRAVIVGAGRGSGHAQAHEWLECSNFGERVTCQGWGDQIWTTLDGAHPQSGEHLLFWERFNCTSAAAAMVAGVVACLQGLAREDLGRVLRADEVRKLLSSPENGTGQVGNCVHPIGPLPDLKKLFASARELGARAA